jgi:hypothetical protein
MAFRRTYSGGLGTIESLGMMILVRSISLGLSPSSSVVPSVCWSVTPAVTSEMKVRKMVKKCKTNILSIEAITDEECGFWEWIGWDME